MHNIVAAAVLNQRVSVLDTNLLIDWNFQSFYNIGYESLMNFLWVAALNSIDGQNDPVVLINGDMGMPARAQWVIEAKHADGFYITCYDIAYTHLRLTENIYQRGPTIKPFCEYLKVWILNKRDG